LATESGETGSVHPTTTKRFSMNSIMNMSTRFKTSISVTKTKNTNSIPNITGEENKEGP